MTLNQGQLFISLADQLVILFCHRCGTCGTGQHQLHAELNYAALSGINFKCPGSCSVGMQRTDESEASQIF